MATGPHKGISGLLVETEATDSQFNIGSIVLFYVGNYLYMHMLFVRVLFSGECLMIIKDNKNCAFTHSADTQMSLGHGSSCLEEGKMTRNTHCVWKGITASLSGNQVYRFT